MTFRPCLDLKSVKKNRISIQRLVSGSLWSMVVNRCTVPGLPSNEVLIKGKGFRAIVVFAIKIYDNDDF